MTPGPFTRHGGRIIDRRCRRARRRPVVLALDGARRLDAEILDSSPTSVRIWLQVMEETRGIPDVIDAVTRHSPALDDLMASEDAVEGLTAFAQKRRPRWRNR
jgi:acetyl-CoA C-acetyltransferase